MKRILTIQDVSCVGKCSLTVALPIISCFGVEAAVMPTAVLSTHTQFKGFTFRDLTSDMTDITDHWKNLGITFDGLYTGYLGSFEQLKIVEGIFDDFKTENNFVLVDPVMADNGKLYTGFDLNFAKNMATLCGKADVIVPNLTEACFMLGEEYIEKGYSEEYIRNLLHKLVGLGAKKALLTGVSFNDEDLGVYGYDSVKKEYFSYYRKRLPAAFHGTGDIFASSLCGAMAMGKDFEEAMKIAVDYTVKCIEITLNTPDHVNYGVEFEKAIPYLIERIK